MTNPLIFQCFTSILPHTTNFCRWKKQVRKAQLQAQLTRKHRQICLSGCCEGYLSSLSSFWKGGCMYGLSILTLSLFFFFSFSPAPSNTEFIWGLSKLKLLTPKWTLQSLYHSIVFLFFFLLSQVWKPAFEVTHLLLALTPEAALIHASKLYHTFPWVWHL